MAKLKIFCVTNKQVPVLENSNFILSGVGSYKFNEKYIKSNLKDNIFFKEQYYSELTFHYWYWKNLLQEEDSEWIGFCQRRRLWLQSRKDIEKIDGKNISNYILREPIEDWLSYESILCEPIKISGAKKVKMIKRGWKNILKNPKVLFDKKLETISFHFDMHHGYGNLSKAIGVMDEEDRIGFLNFVSTKNSFNPHIMFIAKKNLVKQWFDKLFPWLERCEKIFGFTNLKGYDTTRIYAYLAERYLSYWFQKNTKYTYHPWKFMEKF